MRPGSSFSKGEQLGLQSAPAGVQVSSLMLLSKLPEELLPSPKLPTQFSRPKDLMQSTLVTCEITRIIKKEKIIKRSPAIANPKVFLAP